MVVLRIALFFGVLALLILPGWWSLRRHLPERWQPTLQKLLKVTALLFALTLGLYGIGRFYDIPVIRYTTAPIFTALMVAAFLLSLTSLWTWYWKRRLLQEPTEDFDPSRRQFLERTALIAPASALTLSPVGTAMAYNQPLVRKIPIWDDSWDPRLDGLKILQFTDVHLGLLIDVEQIKSIVNQLKPGDVDLVVLTGDIADDLSMLDPAFDVLETLKPTMGIFTSMGNHEIYRGRSRAEEIYRRRSTYLNNDGVSLTYNGASIWLGGVDDPARLFRRRDVFFNESVQKTVENRPEEVSATILLSHRPDAFKAAARHDVSLMLSGHTHGGQAALFGRSIFEPFLPHKFLLGHYVDGTTHLYTSAGLGHWMPFRLNCPCESPLITLTRQA